MSDRGVRGSDRPNGKTGDGADRRSHERVDVMWSVDCETEETFLYAAITNISEMGIFVRTTDPLAVGTVVTLRFAPGGPDGGHPHTPGAREPFVLQGVVQWVNALRPLAEQPQPRHGHPLLGADPPRPRADRRGHPHHRLSARGAEAPHLREPRN